MQLKRTILSFFILCYGIYTLFQAHDFSYPKVIEEPITGTQNYTLGDNISQYSNVAKTDSEEYKYPISLGLIEYYHNDFDYLSTEIDKLVNIYLNTLNDGTIYSITAIFKYDSVLERNKGLEIINSSLNKKHRSKKNSFGGIHNEYKYTEGEKYIALKTTSKGFKELVLVEYTDIAILDKESTEEEKQIIEKSYASAAKTKSFVEQYL